MGCCSNCFNPNKKGEKDKEKNRIQNISIRKSTSEEHTKNKKEYEFEYPYEDYDDTEEQKVEAKEIANKSENQEELYEQMRQIESGTNNVKDKEDQTSNQKKEPPQEENNEIKSDNSFEEIEQEKYEHNPELNEIQQKLKEEKSPNKNINQQIKDSFIKIHPSSEPPSNPKEEPKLIVNIKEPEIIGLQNIKENSMLNAALLALSYTPEFTEYFLSVYNEVHYKKISNEVYKYLNYLWNYDKEKGYYDLNVLKNLLITDGINYQENQSANSFIIKYLLKYLHEENINKINQQFQPNNYIFNFLTSNNSIIS